MRARIGARTKLVILRPRARTGIEDNKEEDEAKNEDEIKDEEERVAREWRRRL